VVYLDKKGIEKDFILWMIIILASAILIIYFMISSGTIAKSKATIDTCRLSVDFVGKGKIFETELSSSPLGLNELNCATEQKEVKTDDVEKIKATLAQAMFECYYEFGEGKIDFVSSHTEKFKGGSTNVCFLCSEMNFNEKASKASITYADLDLYMKYHKPFGSDRTYAQLLNRKGAGLDVPFNLGKTLNVIFMVSKKGGEGDGKTYWERVKNRISNLGDTFHNSIGYATETRSDVLLVSSAAAKDMCGDIISFKPPIKQTLAEKNPIKKK
jgi:hypothetical protein